MLFITASYSVRSRLSKRRNPCNNAIHTRKVGGAAEVPYEIESHAPYPAVVQHRKVAIVQIIISVTDSAVSPIAVGDCIQHRRVVRPAAARLHDDSTFNAQNVMQSYEILPRRVGRL